MRNATTFSEAPLVGAGTTPTPQTIAGGMLYAEFLDAIHAGEPTCVSVPADPVESAPVGDVVAALLYTHAQQRERLIALLAACAASGDEDVSWQACLMLHELASLFATGQVYALTESGAIDA